MTFVLTIAVLLGGEPDLTLSVGNEQLCQRDLLLVKAVLTNHESELLKLRGRAVGVNRIRYQQRVDGQWTLLPAMSCRHGTGGIMPGSRDGDGPILAEGATYAEYDRLLLDRGDNFIFERTGKFEIRAVAETSSGEISSPPVVIVVKPRTPEQLRRMAVSKKWLDMVGRCTLSHIMPPTELIELRDVGGTIGNGIERLLLIERVRRGEESIDKDNVATFLRRKMNGVELEVGLIGLGYHYYQKQDYKRLTEVVDAIPDATIITREWAQLLDLRTPPQFVPKVISRKKD